MSTETPNTFFSSIPDKKGVGPPWHLLSLNLIEKILYFFNDRNPYFTNTMLASKKKARHTRFPIIWILTHSTTQTPNSNLELISPYNIIP